MDERNIEDIIGLSPLQEGLLFHYLQEKDSRLYSEQLTLNISGELRVDYFEKAWDAVVVSNEMLRTVFRWDNLKDPVQLILKRHSLDFRYGDFSDRESSSVDQAVGEIKNTDWKEGFNLEKVPFRVTLCKTGKSQYVVIISSHHILYDGWSSGIMLKEFFEIYETLLAGRSVKPVGKTKFKTFIHWFKGRDRGKEETFWKSYLAGWHGNTGARLSIKKTGTGMGDGLDSRDLSNRSVHLGGMGKNLRCSLDAFVKEHKITPAALFYTVWGILLQRYNNSGDVIFGTTVSGRGAKIRGIEDMVGLFINTLPFRLVSHGEDTAGELLKKTEEMLKAREVYEAAPLVDTRKYSGDGSQGEWFDSLVIVENYPLDAQLASRKAGPAGPRPGLRVDSYFLKEMTHYDLTVLIKLFNDIEIDLAYNPACLEKEAIENLSSHFTVLWQDIMAYPGKIPGRLDILTVEEKRRVLYDFNDTKTEYPKDKTLHRLFEEQVGRTPDYIALLGGHRLDGLHVPLNEVQLTYRALNERVDRRAVILKEKGVLPGGIVGVMMERSIDMMIGILGILKVGAAYLPMDPDFPQERIKYMLSDSGITVLLTNKDLPGEVERPAPVKSAPSHLHRSPLVNAPATSLAYIIYTSGSTGKPKGVAVEHQNTVNFIKGMTSIIDFFPGKVILALTTISFDIFFLETLLPVTCGMKVVVADHVQQKEPAMLKTLTVEKGVEMIQITPSRLQSIRNLGDDWGWLEGVSELLVGGEAFPPMLFRWLREGYRGRLYNVYGPTETTVWSTARDLTRVDQLDIGTPISNTQIYILDRNGSLQPIGVSGELCISGDGAARGYLNNPELTAEKFIDKALGSLLLALRRTERARNALRSGNQPGTFQEIPGAKNQELRPNRHTLRAKSQELRAKLYKTGDLARWLPDGNIQCLGRMDNQVKVRGFRVELGEIESRLLKYPGVGEAVAAVRDDARGNQCLCAYIVLKGEFKPTVLREHLSRELPDYMIPSHFIPIDAVPLTPNGKVNRGALPDPRIKSYRKYRSPRDEVEEKLVKIWTEILGGSERDKGEPLTVGVEDHFFEMGGHSLKATRLVSRIHKVFNLEIPIGDIFKMPVLGDMAAYIRAASAGVGKGFPVGTRVIKPVETREYYPMSSSQQRLFILNEAENITTAYNMFGAVVAEGPFIKERVENACRQLIHRQETLRTSFPIIGSEPVQRVHDNLDFFIEYDGKLLGVRSPVNRKKVSQLRHEDINQLIISFVRSFDLSAAPLLRVGLVKISERRHILMMDMHHIISDGVSIAVLLKEFSNLYKGNELSRLEIHYKDYSIWQQDFLHSEVLKRQESYWLDYLRGERPMLRMPLDMNRPEKRTFEGKTIGFIVPAGISEQLKDFTREHQVTLNVLLFTVYMLLIGLYCDQQEIMVGLLAAGRKYARLESVVGMFVNFLPIRCRIEPGVVFIELVNTVKAAILAAYENQDYPFEKMVENLELTMSPSQNPLFDTVFVLHEEQVVAQLNREFAGLTFTECQLEDRTSVVDFKLDVFTADSGELTCYLQYNLRLFKEESMQRFIFHFNRLLEVVMEDSGQLVEEISLFTPAEEADLAGKRRLNTPEADRSRSLIPLVVSATFTADPISDYIQWWGEQFHWDIQVKFAPYNQVFQQLLEGSGLISTNKGVNVLLVRFEDWVRDIPGDLSEEETCRRLEESFEHLTVIIRKKEKLASYFVGIFPISTHLLLGQRVVECLEEITQRWKAAAEETDNLYVIDFTQLQEFYQVPEVFDPLMDREGHLPFTSEFYAAMGTFIARKVWVLKSTPYKVIALDCDNTLWEGICGEDGLMGVRVNRPYLELQKFISRKYQEGMLLVLCSKNNESDVWEVFEKNPLMLLKKDYFVGWRINWQQKSGNLRELARELNLGLDSFIFIDDNPLECLEVETFCPEVLVLKLPENPEAIPGFLEQVWAFDRLKATEEDKKRSSMYIVEQKRQEIRKHVATLDDFLENLDLRVYMGLAELKDIPRVSQLTQRTNQFNLSTIRRKETEIAQLIQEAGVNCWVVEVTDRFGDYGLVGVVIGRDKGEELFIDTFLLSCRVLGRKVEDVLLGQLRKYCRERGIPVLTSWFYPTAKNRPFQEFMERTQWEKVREAEKYQEYRLPVDKIPDGKGRESLQLISREEGQASANVEDPTKEESKSQSKVESGSNAMLHRLLIYAAQQDTVERIMQLPIHDLNRHRVKQIDYVAPRNEIEKKLQVLWESTLNIKNPGIHDNFFDLGGDSLKSIILARKLKDTFGVDVSSVAIYEHLTLASQVALLEGKSRKSTEAREEAEKKDKNNSQEWEQIRDKIKHNRLRQKVKRDLGE